MALNKESVNLLTVQYGQGIMQVVAEIGVSDRAGLTRFVRPLQVFASQDEKGQVKVGLVPVDPFMEEKADVWVREECVITISTPSEQMYKAYSEARTGLALPNGVSQTPAGLHLVQ